MTSKARNVGISIFTLGFVVIAWGVVMLVTAGMVMTAGEFLVALAVGGFTAFAIGFALAVAGHRIARRPISNAKVDA